MEAHSHPSLVTTKPFLSYLGPGLRHWRSILLFMLYIASCAWVGQIRAR